MANRLEDLLIKEVSGVDDPANEAPGWMVQKAADAVPELDGESSPEEVEAVSTLAKLKEILLGKSSGDAPTNEGDEVSVTKEELTKELDERFAALAEGLVEKFAELTKAEEPKVEEPEIVEEPAPAETPAEVAAGVTADELAKAIEDAQAPILEIMEKMIDRQERVEDMLSIRKSLDGQEGGDAPTEPKAPTLNDAVRAALRGQTVELR